MSKRGNDHQLTSDNFREEDETEEAGTFEKASEEELKGRKKIVAKRRNPTTGGASQPTANAGGFNFVPPTSAPAASTEPTKLNWSFTTPSSTPASSNAPTFVFGTQTDPKDNIIKELEKRVKDLEKECDQLKKQSQEAKPQQGGFAFSFNQPKQVANFPTATTATPTATTTTTTPTPAAATVTTVTPTPVATPVPEKKEVEQKPVVEEKKEEEKKPAASLFNFNFSSGTPSSEPSKLSFGGFSTFSSPFNAAGGDSQFKFEISSKPPTWTNTEYKPKETEEQDEDGAEDPSVPESPSRALSHKIIDLPTIELKSGEEGEKNLAEFKLAKLYRSVTVDNKPTWQQRGVGSLRVNASKDDEKDNRLVMRTDSVLKLILNAKVFKGMKFSPFQEQSMIFSVHKSQLCEQLSADELAKEPEFVSHLIRFDQKNDRATFKQTIETILTKL